MITPKLANLVNLDRENRGELLLRSLNLSNNETTTTKSAFGQGCGLMSPIISEDEEEVRRKKGGGKKGKENGRSVRMGRRRWMTLAMYIFIKHNYL
jgi:hypothetical protein